MAAVSPEAQIAELREQVYRLSETLKAIANRSAQFQRPEASEYYRHGLRNGYAECGYLAEAGLRWALGTDAEPPT